MAQVGRRRRASLFFFSSLSYLASLAVYGGMFFPYLFAGLAQRRLYRHFNSHPHQHHLSSSSSSSSSLLPLSSSSSRSASSSTPSFSSGLSLLPSPSPLPESRDLEDEVKNASPPKQMDEKIAEERDVSHVLKEEKKKENEGNVPLLSKLDVREDSLLSGREKGKDVVYEEDKEEDQFLEQPTLHDTHSRYNASSSSPFSSSSFSSSSSVSPPINNRLGEAEENLSKPSSSSRPNYTLTIMVFSCLSGMCLSFSCLVLLHLFSSSPSSSSQSLVEEEEELSTDPEKPFSLHASWKEKKQDKKSLRGAFLLVSGDLYTKYFKSFFFLHIKQEDVKTPSYNFCLHSLPSRIFHKMSLIISKFPERSSSLLLKRERRGEKEENFSLIDGERVDMRYVRKKSGEKRREEEERRRSLRDIMKIALRQLFPPFSYSSWIEPCASSSYSVRKGDEENALHRKDRRESRSKKRKIERCLSSCLSTLQAGCCLSSLRLIAFLRNEKVAQRLSLVDRWQDERREEKREKKKKQKKKKLFLQMVFCRNSLLSFQGVCSACTSMIKTVLSLFEKEPYDEGLEENRRRSSRRKIYGSEIERNREEKEREGERDVEEEDEKEESEEGLSSPRSEENSQKDEEIKMKKKKKRFSPQEREGNEKKREEVTYSKEQAEEVRREMKDSLIEMRELSSLEAFREEREDDAFLPFHSEEYFTERNNFERYKEKKEEEENVVVIDVELIENGVSSDEEKRKKGKQREKKIMNGSKDLLIEGSSSSFSSLLSPSCPSSPSIFLSDTPSTSTATAVPSSSTSFSSVSSFVLSLGQQEEEEEEGEERNLQLSSRQPHLHDFHSSPFSSSSPSLFAPYTTNEHYGGSAKPLSHPTSINISRQAPPSSSSDGSPDEEEEERKKAHAGRDERHLEGIEPASVLSSPCDENTKGENEESLDEEEKCKNRDSLSTQNLGIERGEEEELKTVDVVDEISRIEEFYQEVEKKEEEEDRKASKKDDFSGVQIHLPSSLLSSPSHNFSMKEFPDGSYAEEEEEEKEKMNERTQEFEEEEREDRCRIDRDDGSEKVCMKREEWREVQREIVYVSFLSFIAKAISFHSLTVIDLTTLAVVKCAKPAAVLLLSAFIGGRRVKKMEAIEVLWICLSVYFFNLSSMSSSSPSSSSLSSSSSSSLLYSQQESYMNATSSSSFLHEDLRKKLGESHPTKESFFSPSLLFQNRTSTHDKSVDPGGDDERGSSSSLFSNCSSFVFASSSSSPNADLLHPRYRDVNESVSSVEVHARRMRGEKGIGERKDAKEEEEEERRVLVLKVLGVFVLCSSLILDSIASSRQDQILLRKFNLSSYEIMFMTSFYGFLLSLFFCGVVERFSGFSCIRDSLSLHSLHPSPSSSVPSSPSSNSLNELPGRSVNDTMIPLQLPSSSLSFSGVHTPQTVPPTSLVHSVTADRYLNKFIPLTTSERNSSSSHLSFSDRESSYQKETFQTSTESFSAFSHPSQEKFLSPFNFYTDFNTPSPSSFSFSLFSFFISSVVFFPLEILSKLFFSLLPQLSISSFFPLSKSFFFLPSFHDLSSHSSSSSSLPSRSTTPAPSLTSSLDEDPPVSLRSFSSLPFLLLSPIFSKDDIMKKMASEEKIQFTDSSLSSLSSFQGRDQSGSPLVFSSQASSLFPMKSVVFSSFWSCSLPSFSSFSFFSIFSSFSSSFFNTPLGCLLLVSVGGSICQLCGILCMKITSAVYVSILTTVRRVLLVLVSIVFVQEGEEQASLPLLARVSVVSISLAG
ncbi:uaa transporter family protein, partial [Cystoisospora suis]